MTTVLDRPPRRPPSDRRAGAAVSAPPGPGSTPTWPRHGRSPVLDAARLVAEVRASPG